MFKKILLMIFSVLILSCRNNTKQITVFFNPARALHEKRMNFKVEFKDRTLLDTVVVNNFVDKGLYLGDFKIKDDGNNVLLIRINNKLLKIKNLDTIPSCSNFFVSYDNFTLLLEEASQIEKGKINKGLNFDYKLIVDSLRKSAHTVDFYDKIELVIKAGKCSN